LRIIEVAAPGAPLGAEWEGNLGTYNSQQWVLERLLKEKLDGTMQGELAESWDVVASGNSPSITFHLRKGVTFHDGSALTAAVIAWNWDMYKKQNMFGATTNTWKSWDIIDDYTIRMNYSPWKNTALRSWENYFMVSEKAYETNGIEWMRYHMVGTGPFVQVDFQKDVSLTTIRNPNYWQKDADGNKLPYLDGVTLLYVADELQRENLMKSGGAEVLNSTTKQASHFDPATFNIQTRNGGPTMLAPDSKNPDSPYAKLNVRLAVEYAIDREALAKSFGYGYDKAAYQLSSAATKAYDPNLAPRMFDLAKAKQLMKDAGYENGFSTTIFASSASVREPLIAIQAMLAKINITADLQFQESAAWQATTTQTAKVNSLIYIPINEWSNYNTTLNVFFSGLGFYLPSNQKPAGYVDMFNASVTAPGPDPTLLKAITDAFYNDCTIIPLVYSTYVFIVTPKVQDSGLLAYGTFNAWNYAYIWLKK
jgi:peptide/nickel transport system substrate-binding protein